MARESNPRGLSSMKGDTPKDKKNVKADTKMGKTHMKSGMEKKADKGALKKKYD